jgi:hypothetical protein
MLQITFKQLLKSLAHIAAKRSQTQTFIPLSLPKVRTDTIISAERHLQLSHQCHSGRTTQTYPKRLHETHHQPLRICQVNSPCHFVWLSITRRHWPPALLRRTRLLQGGTSFDTLPSEYYGYHPASHCPCLVPTYERNQSPHPRSTFHPPTPP